MVEKTRKKGGKNPNPRKTSDAKENNCSPPTDCCPASHQAGAAPAILNPQLAAMGYGMSLGSAVLAVALPNLLGTASLLVSPYGKKAWMLPVFAVISLWYRHSFNQKSKTWTSGKTPCQLSCRTLT